MRLPSRIQSKRISKTPSRSGPMKVFGRMTTAASPPLELAENFFGLDLRASVVPTRAGALVYRVGLGNAVDRRRR